jgi:hypothetical protein
VTSWILLFMILITILNIYLMKPMMLICISDAEELERKKLDIVNDENREESNDRIKKGRKRKYLGLSREENKKNRNSNEKHYNYKGNTIKKKKKCNKNYQCSCTMQCHARLTEDFKIQQFNKYWELANYDAQTTFIGALVKETLKKREYGRGNRIRQYSRTYSFNNIQICRETFINTLGISTKS